MQLVCVLCTTAVYKTDRESVRNERKAWEGRPLGGGQESVSLQLVISPNEFSTHDDVIKWKHFPHYPPATDGFLSQRSVTRSFDVFFDLRMNKQLSK